tara:strand:+ start:144 stop:551 length:408 start_codon:yes stop_codon:yes gene_type:complete
MKNLNFVFLFLVTPLFSQQLEPGIYVSNKYSNADVKDNQLYNEIVLDPYITVVEVRPDGMSFCFEDEDNCYNQDLKYVGVHNGFDTYTGEHCKVFINYHIKGLSLMYNLVDNKYTKTVEFWNLKLKTKFDDEETK